MFLSDETPIALGIFIFNCICVYHMTHSVCSVEIINIIVTFLHIFDKTETITIGRVKIILDVVTCNCLKCKGPICLLTKKNEFFFDMLILNRILNTVKVKENYLNFKRGQENYE